jgi:hypothetical protein
MENFDRGKAKEILEDFIRAKYKVMTTSMNKNDAPLLALFSHLFLLGDAQC